MTPTRERILFYIRSHRAATSIELAQALQMTTANVRHHLAILLRTGQVEVIGMRPAQGRGRPSQVFAASQSGRGLMHLADALLKSMWSEESPEGGTMKLKQLARKLFGESIPAGALSRKLFAAIQRLNELGYQARWEAHADQPQIYFGRCPYAAIIDEHPELCQMDAYALEEMLGKPVTQTAKLMPNPQGVPQCIFITRERLRQDGDRALKSARSPI